MAAPRLNPQQRDAVRHLDGPLLVLAGAGSGKTGVITHKIAHLIKAGYAGGRIAAVTFTNKAAREMQGRVGQLVGSKQGKGLTICTFHSLGLRLLQKEHAAAGLKPGFSIFDAEDSDKLLADLLGRDQPLRKAARAAISRCKGAGLTPEQAMAQAESDGEMQMARAYGEYQRHLRAYNAVDFDDLLALPVQLLATDPALRERWQNRFGYLLVDEYQDTNAAQYALLKHLAGVRAAFTVVGDDDQSIYAWRGAQPGNIADLARDFPRLTVIKLEQNYRSRGRILDTANRLIECNQRAYEKTLWSALGAGDKVRILPCADEAAEAERVVSELLSHRVRYNSRLGDFAILYRGNHQARAFERALRERGAAYRVSGGKSFLERTEVRDLVAYLRLLVNPDDDAAFLRVVNTPRREIGPATLEALGRYANERHRGLFDAARGIALTGRLPERGARRLTAFTDWAAGLMRRSEGDAPAALLQQLISDIDYRNHLRETAANTRQAQRRLDSVDELIAWFTRVGEAEDGQTLGLDAVMVKLGLRDLMEQRDDAQESDKVQLSTLHAAKGLEFDHVFLVGVEEGLLPHQNSLDADNSAGGDAQATDHSALEEERRLLYVGITRARKGLALSYCRQRKRGGQSVDCTPSRFLAELPEETVEWEGRQQASSAGHTREHGRAHLAGLKALLGEEESATSR